MFQFQWPLNRQGTYIALFLQLGSGQMPSGFLVGPFTSTEVIPSSRSRKVTCLFHLSANLGLSHTYPETYPSGGSDCGCSCRAIDVECHLLFVSVCWYSTPAYMGSLHCLHWWASLASQGALSCVGSLSLGTGSRISFGSWATEQLQ